MDALGNLRSHAVDAGNVVDVGRGECRKGAKGVRKGLGNRLAHMAHAQAEQDT